MTRKTFLKACAWALPVFVSSPYAWALWGRREGEQCEEGIRGKVFRGDAPSRPWKWSKEGAFYQKLGDRVRCLVCPNRCLLHPGDRSVCRSKVNIDGTLYSLAYGNPCAVHVDPIEKKPLHHFLPSSWIFSLATSGCNFRCLNCQNWEISQKRPEDVAHITLFPHEVVDKARNAKTPSIAYTYSEPVTFYEYMLDTARLAKEAGLNNVLISNGYINRRPLERLIPFLDGANINLKSFDDGIYRRLNGGTLAPVLETLKTLHRQGVWLEVTTLVVPTYVDRPEMIRRMCGWILKALGPDQPLHLLRFFPRYKLTRLPATPLEILEQLRAVALQEGVRHVYLGNVPGHEGCHTYCWSCKRLLIKRDGYLISENHLQDGRCAFCGARIAGRWA